MLTTTQVLFVTLLALYKYGILSASAADDDYYKLMYRLPEDQRGYVFDMEKRPRYDFGIGKRSLDSNRQRMYAFGLGKRSPLVSNDYDDYYDEKEKRRQYDFGIGKRELGHKMYAFGLGKRNSRGSEDYDVFDFEPREDYNKRLQPYGFGLGKRAAPMMPDGKRANKEYISQRSERYNFGIGKRNADPEGFGYIPSNQHDLYRRASQKFNFGLGKRENHPFEKRDADAGKEATNPPNAYTKDLRYGFGIGKRNADTEEVGSIVPSNQREDSQKLSFGLEKRENHPFEKRGIPTVRGLTTVYITTKDLRYSFGLRKRNAELEKVGSIVPSKQRGASQKLNIGLDKRENHPFEKRDADAGKEATNPPNAYTKDLRYSGGIGKRNADTEEVGSIVPSNLHALNKRASQKLNIGLDKREVSKEDLQQLDDTSAMSASGSSGVQRLSPLEETDSLLEHQQHSSKMKQRESPSSAVDNYALQEISIKH